MSEKSDNDTLTFGQKILIGAHITSMALLSPTLLPTRYYRSFKYLRGNYLFRAQLLTATWISSWCLLVATDDDEVYPPERLW